MNKAEERALEAYPNEHFVDHTYAEMCRGFYEEGYEQAEKDLGWISVKDRLPGPSEWVVACIEQHGHAQCLTLAIYSEETKEWHTDQWEDGEQETFNPDYWMPIPNKVKTAE